MSNRIDFFQPVQSELALPCAAVSIFVDGQLCPELEVIEIIRSGWPEFSSARLAYNPAAYPDGNLRAAEDIEAEFAMGKSLSISRYYNDVYPAAAAFSLPVFDGQIENIRTEIDHDGRRIEIIAGDFSSILERITVYGRLVAKSDGSTVFLAGLKTSFNPDGTANANPLPIEVDGKSFITFCTEPSKARPFTCAEVIDYLLKRYLPLGQLQTPPLERLRQLTEDRCVRDLDVTGSNLLKALHRCCERIGLQFKFVPRLCETGPGQSIVFYKIDTGRVVELNCQQSGEQFSISTTDISRLHSSRNFYPVTYRYIGQGDFKAYEATFDLVKAWDTADEDNDYDKFSPSTNPDFYKIKDVFRKWCLNEAGDYSDQPFNRGQAFDFSKIFGSSNFANGRRRFWPALTTDKQGKSLGYFLQVSFNDGMNWWQYLHAFNNLLDECGIWLSSDRLDPNTWVAAMKGVLKFRITATVIGDERLTAVVADGPTESTVPVVDHIITLPSRFRYQKVSGRSIFANSSDQALGVANEIDDSVSLYEYIRHKALLSSSTIETVDVQTPILMFDYQVGDRVSTGHQSRDSLGVRSDNRSTCCVEEVQMDFVKQCTNLKVVRKRRT